MKRNSVFALVLTLLLAIGTLPLKVPAAEGTDYEEEQAGQVSETEQETGVWKILLPAENEQTGYVIKPIGSTAVPEGGSFTFSLSITDGYKKGKNFAVKAGDVVLKPDPPAPAAGEGATADTKKSENGSGENAGENTNTGENAQNQSAENQPAATGKEPAAGTAGTGSGAAGRETYTIPKITGNVTVTVTGVEKTDKSGQAAGSGETPGAAVPQAEDESGNTDTVSPEDEQDAPGEEPETEPSDEEDVIPGQAPEDVPEDIPEDIPEEQEQGDVSEEDPAAVYEEDGTGESQPEDQDGDPYDAYNEGDQDQQAHEDYDDGAQNQPEYPDYDNDARDQSAYEDYDNGAQDQPEYPDDGESIPDQPPYGDYDNGVQEQDEQYIEDTAFTDAVNESTDPLPSDDDPAAGFSDAPSENTEDTSSENTQDDPAGTSSTDDPEDTAPQEPYENPTETPREGVTEIAAPGEEPEDSASEAATGIGDISTADPAEETSDTSDTPSDTAKETTTASDKNGKALPIWVGGTHATSKNKEDILGKGKVSYDDKTNTLTLKGASIKSAGNKKAVIYYEGTDPLTIVLSGDNSLSDKGTVSGIMSAKSSVTIKGTGTLTIRTDAASSGAGICAKEGDVVISGGTVSSSTTGGGAGIRARNIRIENGISKVQASGKKDALLADNKITLAGRLGIISPKNGKLSGDGRKITDQDGTAAASAVIEPLPVLEITFDPGEGSGTMEKQTVLKGRKLKVPENGFTAPQCKKFDVWRADGKTFKPGTTVRIGKSVTFIAEWKISHTLNLVDYTEPTCERAGNIEHYVCTVCGKLFDDSEAQEEIEEKDTVIRALGHEWDEPSYTWASDKSTATAKRICLRDSSHTETETVKPVRKVVEPACEKKGKYIYTATFKNKAFAEQKKEVELKALGHIWSNPEFRWSNKNRDCEVRLTCSRDSSHKKTVDAEVSGVYTLPTKTADGKVRYTATVKVNGKEETDTAESLISPAGNNDGYRFTKRESNWTKDSKSGISFTVKRDEYDGITYKAFNGIKIDGKSISSNNYTDEKGSLKLHLKAHYLQTLSEGDHTLLVDFKDGTVDTIFHVRARGWKSPRTGDDNTPLLWAGLAAAGLLGIFCLLMIKNRKTGRH